MEHTEDQFASETNPAKFGIRHIQVGLLFLVATTSFGSRASMSVAIVDMTNENSSNVDFPRFDWDSQQRSLILSSLLWGCLLTQIPTGYLLTIVSAKRMVVIGMLFNGLATLLIPVTAEKYGWVAVVCCQVASGMSQGCFISCNYKHISVWVPVTERATLGSFVFNGTQLGVVIYTIVTGILCDSAIGWPGVFYLFGFVSILWSILYQLLGADSPSEHPFISSDEVRYINSSLGITDETPKTKAKIPWKSILKSLPVWIQLIVSCGQIFSYNFFLAELPSYMSYVLKLDIQKSSYVSASPYLAMWLFGFPYSWLSDYAIRKGAPIGCVRKICNSIGMWAPATCLVALSFIRTDNETIYIAIFVLAIGFNAGTMCGVKLNLIDLSPNFAGTLVAITNTIAKCCGLLAPIVCGYIVHDKNDESQWHIVFYLTALIYFLSNLVFLIFGKATVQPWNEHINNSAKTPTSESTEVQSTSINLNPSWQECLNE